MPPADLARDPLTDSRADDTPEGKSLVELAHRQPGADAPLAEMAEPSRSRPVADLCFAD
ncbi:hypothetical protein [Paracoccus marcusii]|uniref:hypothetical protein n=1 Tax=Paracoccus marcusii TaxID=59779 RepID=UPI002491BC8C|nr:hypothetical protein [Paracoccus marcusii]